MAKPAPVVWAATCTRSEFGALVGLSIKRVQDLAGRGVLVYEGDRIRAIESLHRYIESMRRAAQGRQGADGLDITSERARLTSVMRQREELSLAKEMGEVMSLAEVAQGWGQFAATVRSSVLAIPSKVRRRIPHLTAHDQLEVDKVCRECLEMAVEELQGSTIAGATDVTPLTTGPEPAEAAPATKSKPRAAKKAAKKATKRSK